MTDVDSWIVRRVNVSVFLKLANGIVSLQQAVFVTYYCSTGHLFKNYCNYSVLNMFSVDHYFVSYFLSSLSSD